MELGCRAFENFCKWYIAFGQDIRIKFAKAALTGIMANPNRSTFYTEGNAHDAFLQADAMIERLYK